MFQLPDDINLASFDECILIKGGHSASKIYRIKHDGKSYILKQMSYDKPMQVKGQEIFCSKFASTHGIAPACHYANIDQGILILDFINVQPIGSQSERIFNLAKTLRKLHSLPTFPKHPQHSVFSRIEEQMNRLEKYPLSKELAGYFQKICTLQAELLPHLQAVSCHNDLNPNNIIFDGSNSYLVDWEQAGVDDPFFDLATVSNFLYAKIYEKLFLKAYFGRSIIDIENKKFEKMRQIARAYPAFYFLILSAEAGINLAKEKNDSVPFIDEWWKGRKTGEFTMVSSYDMWFYAVSQIKTSLKEMEIENENYNTCSR